MESRGGASASSRPSSGYDDQRLADDVFHALEEAKIQKPVLIGHSMAGGEMTTLGRQHSGRIAGLVYLDAIADLEDDPPADKEWSALQQKLPAEFRPQRYVSWWTRARSRPSREHAPVPSGLSYPNQRHGISSRASTVGSAP